MTAEEYQKTQEEEAKWQEFFTKRKLDTQKEIKERFLERVASKRTAVMDQLFDELKERDFRSMLLVGAAYIEELCKECFESTLIEDSKKEFGKTFNSVITFSFTSQFLYAQDYISDEIFRLITLLRKIRNDLAHNAILSHQHQSSIKSRVEEIKRIMHGRTFTRFEADVSRMSDEQSVCFILIEMLCYSLISLSIWIIPYEKLAKVIYKSDYPFMRVFIWIDNFNPNSTIPKFESKFKNLLD